VVTGSVRNLDIVPTILDYCAIALAKDLNGTSLRCFIEEDVTPNLPTCLETNGLWRGAGSEFQMVGYRKEGYKLVIDLFDETVELYHLEQDPAEQNNLLSATHPAAWAMEKETQLQEELLALLGVGRLDDFKLSLQDMLMDRATTQKLKALGYID